MWQIVDVIWRHPPASFLLQAKERIVPNGMMWAAWPEGRKEFREHDIRHFGPSAGLVDVKVMALSDAPSGLKHVIRLAPR